MQFAAPHDGGVPGQTTGGATELVARRLEVDEEDGLDVVEGGRVEEGVDELEPGEDGREVLELDEEREGVEDDTDEVVDDRVDDRVDDEVRVEDEEVDDGIATMTVVG